MAGHIFGSVAVALALTLSPPMLAWAEPAPDTASAQQSNASLTAAAPLPALSRVVKDEVKALRSGPLLIHGNYCGIGNRPGAAPIDPLDVACMHHDACTQSGVLPSCACDDRLRAEASAVAQDPQTPASLQAVALVTAASMTVLLCR